ncbi:MAG: HAMP domain-containing sensor histidine kinase, partial [Bacteroidota bacterium]
AAADHHRRQQYLQMIQSEKQRGNVLINDMLTSPLLEKEHSPSNLKPIKLTLLFAHRISHFEAYALKKQIILSFERTNLPVLYSDPEALSRILDNLLSNAIKFSSPQQFVTLKLWQQGEQAFFSVADQGPGFSPQDKKHLFEKFKKLSATPTGSEASSGLGLFIVQHLVSLLRGTIQLESELGRGAKFTVSIPINQREADSD